MIMALKSKKVKGKFSSKSLLCQSSLRVSEFTSVLGRGQGGNQMEKSIEEKEMLL